MDVIKTQLARMQQQLGALSASQKMLVVSLVAVMVLTLLFWGRYAGTAEMEPVLDQTMNSSEISRISARIRSMGVNYEVVNERVMVPADRKFEILSTLSYDQLVPEDTRNAYDELSNKISPWDSQANSDAKRNDAKAAYLRQVIGRFPGVVKAEVIIDPTNEHRLGGNGRQPTAMVNITLRDPGAKPEKSLVQAAAATVAGAQSGIAMSKVTVIINGATYPVSDRNGPGALTGDEILAQQQQAERVATQKIQEALGWVSGAIVAVTVDLEITSETRDEVVYDPTKVAQKESQTESETTEETTGQSQSSEPGAVPNTPMTLGGQSSGGSGGNTSTHERTTNKFENHFSTSKIQTSKPAGKPKIVRAAVSVPRSYFVNIYKVGNPNAKEPDDAAIDPLLKSELPKIRNIVRACTDLKNDEDISVEPYTDLVPAMAAGLTSTSTASSAGVGAIMGSHFKEIGIGVLALVSLFMVSGIVKKNAPTPAIAPAAERKETPMLGGAEDIAGDVSEGNPLLDGIEMDEDSIRSQQMVDQVSTMVKENPEAAATLVKRWLNRS